MHKYMYLSVESIYMLLYSEYLDVVFRKFLKLLDRSLYQPATMYSHSSLVYMKHLLLYLQYCWFAMCV